MHSTPSALIVIFGVTGDLSKRKLLPALYHLFREDVLTDSTRIIGVTRQSISAEKILEPVRKSLSKQAQFSDTAWNRFLDRFSLSEVDLTKQDDYRILKQKLDQLNPKLQRIYYLSVPPSVQDDIMQKMGRAGMYLPPFGGEAPRLLVEKPFGSDLTSAKSLVKVMKRYFEEEQIYRIDHYLAKEMAQNILDIRFKNPLFENIWNNHHIKKVVITAHEKIGIENRAEFYEQTGALRDLIQSHLLQIMALVAMEKPKEFDQLETRKERQKLLAKIKLPERMEGGYERAQYESYLDDVGLNHSNTETYAAVRLLVGNRRWENVPFYLRTGKKTNEKSTKVELYFGEEEYNVLKINLQPVEGIDLDIMVKEPGRGHVRKPAKLNFDYKNSFLDKRSAEAYERVLVDAISGDQTLFASSKEVLHAWRIVQPILDEWESSAEVPKIYPDCTTPSLL